MTKCSKIIEWDLNNSVICCHILTELKKELYIKDKKHSENQ